MPRDLPVGNGAPVAAALIDAGYSELSRIFFDFCHKAITEQRFLLHKYTPDGSLASSWHAWYRDGEKRLPIQEDETALVLWARWQHFHRFRDIEFVKCHYRGLIVRVAEWICSYIDEDTGLSLPSWDLWKKRYGIHSWTVAAVWAGLQSAANFTEAFGENELSIRYRQVAATIRKGALQHLYNQKEGRFVRSLLIKDNSVIQDPIMDASLIGLWSFGLFPADDPLIIDTMETMRLKFWVRSNVGGMVRYENDYYHQVSNDTNIVPGNPWFICTLWLAQWFIATATRVEELNPALELIEWTADHTLQSGIMAEQVHPHTNEPLPVSPLTWSHATYISAILHYHQKHRTLTADDN